MASLEILAVSPGLPVDDLLAHDEGGHRQAVRAVSELVPGARFDHVQSDTWAAPGLLSQDVVLVSTFGPTTLFRVAPPTPLTVPAGLTTFRLSFQTVSMAWGVEVSGPRFERVVALSPGALDHAEGAPLPFEAAFPDVTEASATYSFDQDAYAAAAAEWMFGCQPLELDPDHRVDLGSRAIHALRPAPARVEPGPPASAPRPRRGALARLFQRH